MTELQQHAQRVRETLRLAVARALDTKRRLGQYAVVYQDGKTVRLTPDSKPSTDNN